MTCSHEDLLILAADIGATNCRFALYKTAPELTLVREQWFKGADFASFGDILDALKTTGPGRAQALLEQPALPDIVAIAVAGPITHEPGGEHCHVTNRPWHIRSAEVAAVLGLSRVWLLNDFAAQAYACLLPEKTGIAPILPGKAETGAPCAVTGAGTGFGTALITNLACGIAGLLHGSVTIMPGEGGLAEFPFVGREEMDFARFAALETGTDRLVGDTVLGGEGLASLFMFLTGKRVHPHEATAKTPGHPDVMTWYARFYARACRVYVLHTLALGGLFVTGGMALRVPVLEHPAFAAEFYENDAQRQMLAKVPVWHLRKPEAGLWGAALFGWLQTKRQRF